MECLETRLPPGDAALGGFLTVEFAEPALPLRVAPVGKTNDLREEPLTVHRRLLGDTKATVLAAPPVRSGAVSQGCWPKQDQCDAASVPGAAVAVVCNGALSISAAARPTVAESDLITFISDTSWSVSDALGDPVGDAQYVCLNSDYPSSCPPGATLYGFAGAGWFADLSSIPGAAWIYAPGITGSTPNASLALYSFAQQIDLPGLPVYGFISVAVDDFAEVFVNGMSAGTTGSVTDIFLAFEAQSSLRTFDITPFLVSGENTIQIVTQNGPDSFPGIPDARYSDNTAGVVFGGALVYKK